MQGKVHGFQRPWRESEVRIQSRKGGVGVFLTPKGGGGRGGGRASVIGRGKYN